MDKKSIVNDLYQAAVMLGKKVLKIAPPSVQNLNLEDTGKLDTIRFWVRYDEKISH